MTTANDDIVQQIRVLEDARYQAITDGDVGTLADLFATDLAYTHSDASTDTKQSYLDRLSSGALAYGPIEHPESSIIVHGDTAIVVADMRGEARINGTPRALNSKTLAVWVREGDGWVLLAFQPTKYPA